MALSTQQHDAVVLRFDALWMMPHCWVVVRCVALSQWIEWTHKKLASTTQEILQAETVQYYKMMSVKKIYEIPLSIDH